MNKSLTLIVAVIAALVLLSSGASAKRLRTNPNRAKYSAPVEEQPEESSQIDVDELQEKFSFPDPSAKNFKTLESDRKSFGVSSGSNSHFSDLSSSFGKGLKKKKKPAFAPVEEDEDTDGSYEVNYKTTVTHKPGSSYDSGSSYKFPSLSSSGGSKTKFGSSTKFSSFNHQGSGSSQSGIFKLNEPSTGQITTKFAINHPAPTHTASSLGGSYQTFPDDGSYPTSGHLTEKFISDYQSALSKLKSDHHSKNEHPKFEAPSSYKTKFHGDDGSNFKVSSDFKVGSESHPTHFHKSTKLSSSPDVSNFKPNFRLQEVPNLYPSDDQFRPSVGFSESSHGGANSKLFEPSADTNNDFVKQQLASSPASKGQYQQFLKSQQDEKIEQQALLEQLKYQQLKQGPIKGHGRPLGFSGSSTKFRPYVNVKSFNRRKPARVISSPGLGHYRTPIIDGPYTIHFSV